MGFIMNCMSDKKEADKKKSEGKGRGDWSKGKSEILSMIAEALSCFLGVYTLLFLDQQTLNHTSPTYCKSNH